MDRCLLVPNSCLPQILAQRTGCKKAPDPAGAWSDSIWADWTQVAQWIPSVVSQSLDIGCGLGGFDVMLWRARHPFMFLLDRDNFQEKPRYGYGDAPSAYCRFDQVEQMMRTNGVHPSMFETIVTTAEVRGHVDLVTSFIAWGFHFPVDVYLGEVARILRPGGRLIIDIRLETWAESNQKIRNDVGPLLAKFPFEKHIRGVFEMRPYK